MKTKNAVKILGLAGLLFASGIGLFGGCAKVPEEHKIHQVTDYPVGKKRISVEYNKNGWISLGLEGSTERISYNTSDLLNVVITTDNKHVVKYITCYKANAKGDGLLNAFAFFNKGEHQIIKPAQDSVNKWIGYIDLSETMKKDSLQRDRYHKRLELGRKILE